MPDPAISTPPGGAFLRTVAIAAQAATIAITWPLWQVREGIQNAPLLPLFDGICLPQVPFGWLLLGSLLLALWRHLPGAIVHGALLAVAISMDQTR